MAERHSIARISLLLTTTALTFAACGGGGSSGSVSGLNGPQQVAIVDSDNTSASTLKLPSYRSTFRWSPCTRTASVIGKRGAPPTDWPI